MNGILICIMNLYVIQHSAYNIIYVSVHSCQNCETAYVYWQYIYVNTFETKNETSDIKIS